MNEPIFYRLLNEPLIANENHKDSLQEIIDSYPYFQAAKLILALAQPTTGHIKQAAVNSQDRNLLKRLIDAKINPEKENDLYILEEKKPVNLNTQSLSILSDTLEKTEEQKKQVTNQKDNNNLKVGLDIKNENSPVNPDLNNFEDKENEKQETKEKELKSVENTENKSVIENDFLDKLTTQLDSYQKNLKSFEEDTQKFQKVNKNHETENETINIGESINTFFDQNEVEKKSKKENENHVSFDFLANNFALDENENNEEKSKKEVSQSDIISDFIDTYPKQTRNYQNSVTPTIKEDLELEDDSLGKEMKEYTSIQLVNLLVSQKKYQQAITMYKNLAIKQPDQKIYFEQEIEKLQRQIEKPNDDNK